MRKYFYLYTAVILLISGFICSCSTQNEEIETKTEREVVFVFDSESIESSETRSLTDAEEVKVEEVDVLLFSSSGNYVGYAAGYDWNYNLSSNSGTFKAYVQTGTNLTFVIVTNARAEVIAATKTTLSAFVSSLMVSSTNEWPANINGSSDFRLIPMYGKITGQTVSETYTEIPNNVSESIYLIRMLARIDVSKAATISESDFELTSASIFQRNDKGFVAYNSLDANNNVTSTNIPTSAVKTKLPNLAYNITSSVLTNSIYTFESKGINDRTKATAIVVGGKYDSSLETTFYRIDIPPATPPASGFLSGDILRNHIYNIEIQGVTGPGFETEEDAYDKLNVNLKTKVTKWVDGGQKESDNYYVIVDKDKEIRQR